MPAQDIETIYEVIEVIEVSIGFEGRLQSFISCLLEISQDLDILLRKSSILLEVKDDIIDCFWRENYFFQISIFWHLLNQSIYSFFQFFIVTWFFVLRK